MFAFEYDFVYGSLLTLQAVIVEHETFDFDSHDTTYPCEGLRSSELKA